MYTERYRPQFHFTSEKNWLNDPNGCVFYDEEYHLFFQHNPDGIDWGNMTWGHAVSPDLVHWRQLPLALRPYDNGTIFSGSAVVDSSNLSGLGTESQIPLVAAFTHARKPFGQALASSTDSGRTWQLYAAGQHVVPNQGLAEDERDPKIFWHAQSRQWIMVLWVRQDQVRFFTSANLRQWNHASDFSGTGFYECPDLFPLPLDGDPQKIKWVLVDAAFHYWVGAFDGRSFVPEAGPLLGDFGSNFYAAQTWNNTDTRIVQIGWMRGGQYPGMPFNQQMSFPCDLSLRHTPHGIRLCRTPVAEINTLRVSNDSITNHTLGSQTELSIGSPGDCFDIEATIAVAPGAGFRIRVSDQVITYNDQQIHCLGKSATILPIDGRLSLRILIDRTSIEIFGNRGEVCLSSCFLPADRETVVRCAAETGSIRIHNFVVHRLSSAWE